MALASMFGKQGTGTYCVERIRRKDSSWNAISYEGYWERSHQKWGIYNWIDGRYVTEKQD